MLPLVLNYSGGGYELLIPNVDGPEGAIGLILNADDEAASVRLLAESMSQGINSVVENSEFIFDAGGPLDAEAVEAIFESADSLIFGVAEPIGIFAAEEGETLLESIVAAGEELVEFAAAL